MITSRTFTDCHGEGCDECDVCNYLSFLDYAYGCAPAGESHITRNREIDEYLKLSDEQRKLVTHSPA